MININYQEFTLRTNMRRLWIEQVIYTRLYVISSISDLGDIEFTTKRLTKNVKDISLLFKIYYPEEKSKQIEELLKEHTLIMTNFIDKTIKSKIEKSIEEKKKWYANTEQISILLSKMSPKLSNSILRNMLFEYLDTTEKEFISRYHRDYKEDIETFDNLQNQITQLADVLSESIIKTYPDKFTASKFDQLLG